MAADKTPIDKANDYAVRADTWWSLFEKLWDARAIMGWTVAGAGLIASAIYKVVGFVNQFGWGGWVLALVPSIIIAGLVFAFFDWLLHLRRVRRIREGLIPGGSEAAPQAEPAEQPNLAVLNILNEERFKELDNRIHALERAIAERPKPSRDVSDLSAEMTQLRTSVAPLVGALDAISKLKVAREVQYSLPKPPDDPKRLLDRMGNRKDPITIFFESNRPKIIGDLQGELEISSADHQVQRIMSDAKYLTLLPGEEERFGTQENKRAWHILEARCRVVADAVNALVNDLERRAAPLMHKDKNGG